MRDHYESLELGRKASSQEIKRNYRRLARKFHPDVNPGRGASRRMAEINEAYRVLSDPVTRAEYDAAIERGLSTAPKAQSRSRLEVSLVQRFLFAPTPSPIYSLDFGPGRAGVAVGLFANQVVIHSPFDGKVLRTFEPVGGAITAIRWRGKDELLGVGLGDKSVSFWRLRGASVVSVLNKHADWVSQCAIRPDGKLVALGSLHRTLIGIHFESGETVYQRRKHEDAITALTFSWDNKLLASGGNDSRVIIWDADDGKELMHVDTLRAPPSQIAFSADGSLMAVALIDHGIRLFELHSGALRATMWGHEKPVESLVFHPNSRLLCSASRDSTLRLWSSDSCQEIVRVVTDGHPVKAVCFSRDGKLLAAGGLGRSLAVWRVVLLGKDA
jgi:WD40 repeat protein